MPSRAGPGSRRCSRPRGRSRRRAPRRHRPRGGRRGDRRGVLGRRYDWDELLLERAALGQSRRAARARARRARRGGARQVRAPRRDEPGHPRHGRDARGASALGLVLDRARPARPTPARGWPASIGTRRWRDGRSSSRRSRRRSGSRRRGGSSGLTMRADALPSSGDGLAAQLGGAAGTLAALGERGSRSSALFARELDLAEPTLPWHANRVRSPSSARRSRSPPA